MFFALLSLSLAIPVVRRATVEQTLQYIKAGPTFFIAASSSDFAYPSIVSQFRRSAYVSNLHADFLIIDTSEEKLEPSALNASQFPILGFGYETVKRIQYRGFDSDFFTAFFNTNFPAPIKTINTQEELETLFSTAALALLVADKKAVSADVVETIHRDHFNELTVRYANPELFEEPGNYLYRYLDATLVKINLTDSINEVLRVVSSNSPPKYHKINSYVASMLESEGRKFVNLMLSLEDFYLSQEHLDLARKLETECGVNVTYSDLENSQITSFRYNIPESLDPTLAFIDVSGERLIKYLMPDVLTTENALAFVKNVLAGNVEPFWRSDIDSTKQTDHVVQVNANLLTKYVKEKKDAVIAIYFSNLDPIEGFVNATKTLNDGKIYGRFSAALNDWSADYVDVEDLPRLVVLEQGKVVYNDKLKHEEAEVAKQIQDAVQDKSKEL